MEVSVGFITIAPLEHPELGLLKAVHCKTVGAAVGFNVGFRDVLGTNVGPIDGFIEGAVVAPRIRAIMETHIKKSKMFVI